MNRFKLCACFAFALAALPARAEEPKLPPDLAAVPGNAIGFVHIRVADLWKCDALKDFRVMIEKAGPKALQAFDDRFVPAPSTIDRITVFGVMQTNAPREAPFVAVIACNQPFEGAKLLKSLLPRGKEIKAGNATFHADEDYDLAIHLIDSRVFAVATVGMMRQYLETPPTKENSLTPALRQAAGKHHVVMGLDASQLPDEAVAELPPAIQPLARTRLVAVALDVGKDLAVDLRLHFAEEAQAKSGEKAARDGLSMARTALTALKAQAEQELKGKKMTSPAPISELPEAVVAIMKLGGLNLLDAFLKDLPLQRNGNVLVMSTKLPVGPYVSALGIAGMSAGFALPAVQKARMASTSSRSANNLKQIALAFHNYHSSYNGFPPAAICDKNGKPLLSWRVAILPYIEQDKLYKQFHLDEPWDSEHNKKLLALMPKTYMLPNLNTPGETNTHYRVFYGGGAAFELKKSVRITDFSDGTSNTILLVESAEGVPWTKPDDFEYDPKKPLPKFGAISSEGFWIALADGSVRFVSHKLKESTIRAAITRNGGEVFNWDE